jgi:hypothetical protein
VLIFGDSLVWFGAGILILFGVAIFALFARGSAPPPMKAFVLREKDRSLLQITAANLRNNSGPAGRRSARKVARLQDGADEGVKVAD